MTNSSVKQLPVTFVRMPSEPPAALVEMLQHTVFYNDDAEIGTGLAFRCYREIHAYLKSRGTILLISS